MSNTNGNLVVRGMHITPWHTSNSYDIDVDREVQLLAHKKEIIKLENKLKTDGYTLIPLKYILMIKENVRCLLVYVKVNIHMINEMHLKRNRLREI